MPNSLPINVMDTPNPKRQCRDDFSSIQSPTIASEFNQNDFDSTISSFLLLPDSPYNSIGCSFDRVLGQVLDSASEASGDDSVRDRLIDRTNKLAFLLLESTKRFSRMRSTHYNYNSWSLPEELTIKVMNFYVALGLSFFLGRRLIDSQITTMF